MLVKENPQVHFPDSLSVPPLFGKIEAFIILELLAVESLTPGLPNWIIEGSLAENGCAFSFAQAFIISPSHRSVGHATIVPNGHSSWCPPPTNRQIVSRVHMLTQEGQHVHRLLLFQLLNMNHDRRVIVYAFEFGDRVGTDLSERN